MAKKALVGGEIMNMTRDYKYTQEISQMVWFFKLEWPVLTQTDVRIRRSAGSQSRDCESRRGHRSRPTNRIGASISLLKITFKIW